MGVVYTAETVVEGGRTGHARSSDGKLDVDLTMPLANGGGTNPEPLFAAGYSACFLSAVEYHARQAQVELVDPRVDATVELVEEDGAYFLRASLDVSASSVTEEQLAELVRQGHDTCPYSKATRGNMDVKLAVGGRPLETAPAL